MRRDTCKIYKKDLSVDQRKQYVNAMKNSLYIASVCLFKSFLDFFFRSCFVTQHLEVASESAFTKVDVDYVCIVCVNIGLLL